MDEDYAQLSDPDLLAECARVGAIVEVLSARYRALGAEFTRRTEVQRTADGATKDVASLPVPVARMLAVEILLAQPESLEDDGLESSLYVLREKLRTDRPASPLQVAITVG